MDRRDHQALEFKWRHGAIRWKFDDATQRLAFTLPDGSKGVLPGGAPDAVTDSGSLAWQTDNDSVWMWKGPGLTDWVQVNGSGGTLDYGETGDLSTVGAVNDAGASSEVARADHVHAAASVTARLCTTVALPAYTYNNGTFGVGATLTANGNGAIPTIDGATPVLNDLILVQNGAAWSDNGLYKLTQVGDGGTPWILTRSVFGDTQAKILAVAIRITEGLQSRGAIYQYINNTSITMGTTALAWIRVDQGRTANEVSIESTDFDQSVAALAQASILAGGMPLFCRVGTGMAMAIQASTATEKGVIQLSTGSSSSAANVCALSYSGALQPMFVTVDQYLEVEIRAAGPNALSDGSQTFRWMFGLSALNDVTGTDGIWIEHTHTADATHWLATTRASSTSTSTVGPTITTSTYYRFRIVKYAGETTVHFYADNIEIGTGQATNVPLGVGIMPFAAIVKSLGATARTANMDNMRVLQAWPRRRAA